MPRTAHGLADPVQIEALRHSAGYLRELRPAQRLN
jgi:hypothetical protein